MIENLKYQIRVYLSGDYSLLYRTGKKNKILNLLENVLKKNKGKIQCQYDAFVSYVKEAEKYGLEEYPLYEWTKATIENPIKKEKYLKSFTVYVDEEEVYSKIKAEKLEKELLPLLDEKNITRISKHDTNPANNPQPPEKYRRS